jgi:hypothetical protein
MQIRILCNGQEVVAGPFVGRFVGNVCFAIVTSLKAPRPSERVLFVLEEKTVSLEVDAQLVPMDYTQGFARTIVRDTLGGMIRHLKGIDPDGTVRIEIQLEAQP